MTQVHLPGQDELQQLLYATMQLLKWMMTLLMSRTATLMLLLV